jgi:hypothetical protein
MEIVMKKLTILLFGLALSYQTMASQYTASCINFARAKNMSSSTTAKVCKNATAHTASCINFARARNMSSSSTVIACSNATKHSASCINMARARNMSSDATAVVCSNASSNTASCINISRARNMSSDSTAEVCSEEAREEVSQSSFNNESRLKILLLDALANIDSNPERAKAHIQNILLELEME